MRRYVPCRNTTYKSGNTYYLHSACGGAPVMARGGTPAAPKVTSRDVARAAEVSQALVSRAFSGNGRIAPATRERILKVAAEIGWQPNALAAGMVTGDAPLVAVITTRLHFDWRAQVLSRLLKAFEERRLKPILFYAERDDEVDRLLGETLSWQVRGVVVTAGVVRPERAEAILGRGKFLAALNRPANHPAAYGIATDNLAGGAQAAKVLLSEGRTRFLLLAGPEDSWASSRRTEGFVGALAEAGHSARIWHNTEMTSESGMACGRRVLALAVEDRPDAVFATNDALALGFVDGLRDSATRLPDDMSLIGFDNLPSSSWAPYRLTTFEQPLDLMVDGVLDHIETHRGLTADAPTEHSLIACPPRLILRNTTRTPQ